MYKLYEYCKNCGNGSFCVMLLYGCKLSVTCVNRSCTEVCMRYICAKIKKLLFFIKKKKNNHIKETKSIFISFTPDSTKMCRFSKKEF